MIATMPTTPPQDCARCGSPRSWVLNEGSYRPTCSTCLGKKMEACRAADREKARTTYCRKRSTLQLLMDTILGLEDQHR